MRSLVTGSRTRQPEGPKPRALNLSSGRSWRYQTHPQPHHQTHPLRGHSSLLSTDRMYRIHPHNITARSSLTFS